MGVNAFFVGAGAALAAWGMRAAIQSSGAIRAKAPEAAKVAGEAGGKAFGNMTKMFAWTNSYPGGFNGTLTRREAFQILGLREGSNRNKVREAHKKLMIANHPDSGGSPFIATKVNEAKDFILSGRTQ